MKISNHLLVAENGENIAVKRSPNQSAPFSPIYLIVHYTAGRALDGAVSWFFKSAGTGIGTCRDRSRRRNRANGTVQ